MGRTLQSHLSHFLGPGNEKIIAHPAPNLPPLRAQYPLHALQPRWEDLFNRRKEGQNVGRELSLTDGNERSVSN